MKTLQAQKRMAAKVMDIGKNKVWFDPERLSEIKEAITKMDIADLIKDGAISKSPVDGIKRRAGKRHLKRKRKGRRRRAGSIKRTIKTDNYPSRIRKLRSSLKNLRKAKKITTEQYRKMYNLLKSGVIKNNQQMAEYTKQK
jgi:large subunit ribosomal protein L19e